MSKTLKISKIIRNEAKIGLHNSQEDGWDYAGMVDNNAILDEPNGQSYCRQNIDEVGVKDIKIEDEFAAIDFGLARFDVSDSYNHVNSAFLLTNNNVFINIPSKNYDLTNIDEFALENIRVGGIKLDESTRKWLLKEMI